MGEREETEQVGRCILYPGMLLILFVGLLEILLSYPWIVNSTEVVQFTPYYRCYLLGSSPSSARSMSPYQASSAENIKQYLSFHAGIIKRPA